MKKINYIDYFLVIPIFLFSLIYFYPLDKGMLLERQFSPWDSFYYREIANSFLEGKFVSIMYPFNERVLFPFIIANFVKIISN